MSLEITTRRLNDMIFQAFWILQVVLFNHLGACTLLLSGFLVDEWAGVRQFAQSRKWWDMSEQDRYFQAAHFSPCWRLLPVCFDKELNPHTHVQDCAYTHLCNHAFMLVRLSTRVSRDGGKTHTNNKVHQCGLVL